MFFQKKPVVKFWTENELLLQQKDLWPQPASKFFPEWFKKIKPTVRPTLEGKRTIRDCPVFAEYLTQGYIIPMWCDTILKFNSNDRTWQWNTSAFVPRKGISSWDDHDDSQYIDFIPVENKENMVVLKAICPWHVKVSKGYSLYQQQMYYHYNSDWEILPGSIHSDLYHEINQQVLIKKADKEIFIPRGAPFVWYIPYKREKYNLQVVKQGEEEYLDYIKGQGSISSHLLNGYKKLVRKNRK